MRQRALDLLAKLRFFPPTLARFTLGFVFLQSGWGKLHNLAGVIEYFESLHIPAASIQAPMAAATEFVCGIALLIGLLTRLASAPIIVIMCVAIATAKSDFEGIGGLFALSEYLYIVLACYLIIEGPGPIAVDHALAKRYATATSSPSE